MTELNERHQKMIKLFEERGEIDISTLALKLNTSEATVRRDLIFMENQGLLIRTLGGARLLDHESLVVRTFQERRNRQRREKARISVEAATYVKPGMVVAVDSGTTPWRVAGKLKDKAPLTVLTSALAVIEELGSVQGISLYCVGGQFRLNNLDFVGIQTIDDIKRMHSDVAFLGADAFLPGRGVFIADSQSTAVTEAIVDSSDLCVVVLDHTKINARGTFLAIPSNRINHMITDSGLNEETRQALDGEPFELTVV